MKKTLLIHFGKLKFNFLKILMVASISIMSIYTQAQPWYELTLQEKVNFKHVCNVAEAYFDSVGRGPHTGYKLFKRWEYMASRDIDSKGFVISDAQVNEEREKSLRNRSTTTGDWKEYGPFTWTRTSSWNPGLGRIVSIAVEPTQQQLMYAGSPGGGIWRSNNGGAKWDPIGDNINMQVWAIAIDPRDNKIVYHGNNAGRVLRSTNGGDTWSNTGNQISGTPRTILIHPNNTNIIWVGTTSGIYRTENSGGSWTRISTSRVQDIVFKPGDLNTLYACDNDFFRSTDGGLTFTRITSGIVASERMKIAVTPAQPNYVYLVQKKGSGFGRIYRSTNGGTSFSIRSDIDNGAPNYLGSQAGRDMAIMVSNTNAEEVHLGGLNNYRSLNGGTSFTELSGWSQPTNPAYIHADVEVMMYVNGVCYAGTDGGIYRSTDQGNNYEDLTRKGRLSAHQFYRIGGSLTDANRLSGGSQDNGTNVMRGENREWIAWLGADGMETFIDYTNENIIYGTSQYGTLYKSTNGGNSRFNLTKPVSENGSWVTPFEIDPQIPTTIYAGFDNLYRHRGGGQTGNWENITTGINIGGNLNEVALAPSNNNYIYIARGTNMWVTKNGQAATPSWTSISNFTGNVNYISVDPDNPERVAIAATGNNVYVSTNAGNSWTNIKAGLPNMAVQCVLLDHKPDNGIYVGLQSGVYYTNDNLTGWVPFDQNLPNVETRELEIHVPTEKIRLCTYGRGLWESGLYGSTISPSITALGNTIFCTGGNVRLRAENDNLQGATYQWYRDGNLINNATSREYQATTSGMYKVKVTLGNASGESNETQVIAVSPLDAPVVSSVTRCGPGEVVLRASGDSQSRIVWYRNNEQFGEGDSIVATLDATAEYTVRQFTSAPIQSVGPNTNTFGATAIHAGGFFLQFDALKAITIKTARVYADVAKNRTFILRDAQGNQIDSRTVNVSQGTSRVTLNFNVPEGVNYQIGVAAGADLYRNEGNMNFPYQIEGLVSIKSGMRPEGELLPDYYYYLYDWEVQENIPECPGVSTEAKAIIIQIPEAPEVYDETVCAPGSEITLTVLNSSEDMQTVWYADANKNEKLIIGDSYSLNVTAETTVYVENAVSTPIMTGLANNSGTGVYHAGGFYLLFDAMKPFTLKSGTVYAEGAGDRTLVLLNSANEEIANKTINLSNGTNIIDLDLEIPAGENMKIGFNTTANLYRNEGTIPYPIVVEDLLSIKSGVRLNGEELPTFYYYLYNWEVIDNDANCVSPLKSATVTIEVCTSTDDWANKGLEVFPNPTNSVVYLSIPNGMKVTGISIVNPNGITFMASGDPVSEIDLTGYAAGIYFVEIISEGKVYKQKLIVK